MKYKITNTKGYTIAYIGLEIEPGVSVHELNKMQADILASSNSLRVEKEEIKVEAKTVKKTK